MMSSKAEPIHIAIVVFNDISLFHLSVPLIVFGENRRALGVPEFKISLCSVEGNTLIANNGITMMVANDLTTLESADIIIIPAWHSHDEQIPKQLIAALQKAYQHNKLLVGLCLATFVLAEAGVLAGKTVTTHWHWAELFRKCYPDIKLNPDVLYIDEGQVITSAGTAAALDCCLHLLRRLCGAKIANKVAKQLVIAPHRRGGQVQFIEQAIPTNISNNRLSALLGWLLAHLAEHHSIDQLAKQTAMSRRSFTRHFKQLTGCSVTQWLIEQRLAKVQELLESSTLSIEQIAVMVGFGSGLVLRQHFIKKIGISINQYRKSFQQENS